MTGSPEIDFYVELDAASVFGEVTKKNVGQRLCHRTGWRGDFSPNINTPILGVVPARLPAVSPRRERLNWRRHWRIPSRLL